VSTFYCFDQRETISLSETTIIGVTSGCSGCRCTP